MTVRALWPASRAFERSLAPTNYSPARSRSMGDFAGWIIRFLPGIGDGGREGRAGAPRGLYRRARRTPLRRIWSINQSQVEIDRGPTTSSVNRRTKYRSGADVRVPVSLTEQSDHQTFLSPARHV